jgi:hypothetical protein
VICGGTLSDEAISELANARLLSSITLRKTNFAPRPVSVDKFVEKYCFQDALEFHGINI